jgi:hypothetical protein
VNAVGFFRGILLVSLIVFSAYLLQDDRNLYAIVLIGCGLLIVILTYVKCVLESILTSRQTNRLKV